MRVDRRRFVGGGLALGAAPMLAAAGPAVATNRKALVIGNGAYKSVRTLKNPANDANALAAALRRIGFEVTPAIDVDIGGMDAALGRFTRGLAKGDVAMVFFAGHGLQAPGREGVENYLIPVDATLETPEALERECLPVSRVFFDLYRSPARVRMVVLDACRENAFPSRWKSEDRAAAFVGGGLAPADQPGAIIAYATKPGGTADDNPNESNGLFTAELLKQLERPGQPIAMLFGEVQSAVSKHSKGRQEPWIVMGGDSLYVLNEGAATKQTVEVAEADLAGLMAAARCSTEACFAQEIARLSNPTLAALGRKNWGGAAGPVRTQEGPRAAFVLGVADYGDPNIPRLPGAEADARALAETLHRTGFEHVALSLNPDRRQFGADFASFTKALTPGSRVLFYFAGMGFRALTGDGARYDNVLATSDFQLFGGPDQGVRLQTVLEALEAARPAARLVLIDTCDTPIQEKPTAASSAAAAQCGFSLRPPAATKTGAGYPDVPAARGVLFGFSTSPGEEAIDVLEGHDNGPFMVHLLKALQREGASAREILARVSADVSAATGGMQRPFMTSAGETADFVPGARPPGPAIKPVLVRNIHKASRKPDPGMR